MAYVAARAVKFRAAVLLGALVAAACTTPAARDAADGDGAREPTVAPIETEFVSDDTRNVDLPFVEGAAGAPTPVTITGGEAMLRGTVIGPDGAVSGAQVRIERFVGDRSASLDITSGATGSWAISEVQGGRYRIRAWRAPDLGMIESVVRFVSGDETTDGLDLRLGRYDGPDLQAVMSTRQPVIGERVTVTALVTAQAVGADGTIRSQPRVGSPARLRPAGDWELSGPQRAAVTSDGRVSWTLECTRVGALGPTVEALGLVTSVNIAPCSEEAVEPPDTDPPDPDFPVGSQFTPPFEGPIAAGTYVAVGDPGTCGLVYQPWINGEWSSELVTVTGVDPFSVTGPARDLRPLGESPPCTYERIA